ncbi:MAG: DNA methyltransferase [Phototrophicaceae bacterium]
MKPNSLIEDYINQQGTGEIRLLDIPFDYPKPSGLIKYLLNISKVQDDDLILDFFAGSATTAQAVLELNREDGGKRRFILVQLPEPTNNPTYPTIADISKERVRRVIERMHAQQTEQLQGWVGNPDEDLGFRVFKLQPSSIQSLDDLPEDASVAEQLTFLENPLKEGWSMEAVIAEVALKEMGFGLSYRIESVPQVVAHTVYRVVDDEREQSFYLCLDSTLTLEGLKPLAFKPDDLFVFLDSAIDDTVVANLILRCRIKRL